MGEVTKSILFILIISSLAIIGIASNQSYAGSQPTPPPSPPIIGDFKCYLDEPLITAVNVKLYDQFFPDGVDVSVIQYFKTCTQVIKSSHTELFPDSDPPQEPNTHFRVYTIDSGPAVSDTILLTDQFGTTRATVNEAVELWVPADKLDSSKQIEFPKNSMDIHWKCYNIQPQTTIRLSGITLTDQFMPSNSGNNLDGPFKMCNPVIKELADGSQFGSLIDDHLKCYDINPKETPNPIAKFLSDQFVLRIGLTPTDFISEDDVCLVAGKDVLSFDNGGSVGGTRLHIGTTAVLLAGAQMTAARWSGRCHPHPGRTLIPEWTRRLRGVARMTARPARMTARPAPASPERQPGHPRARRLRPPRWSPTASAPCRTRRAASAT